jgi:hypothetical protein
VHGLGGEGQRLPAAGAGASRSAPPHHLHDVATPAIAHWKLAGIDRYAGPSRRLAWIDDAHDDGCNAWARARTAPTLLVATEPAVGITDEHVAQLLAWASSAAVEPTG